MSDQAIATIDHSYTASEMKSQVQRIQEVMRSVMQDGQHYGTVPGCGPKPTLLKPGAEKLMMTFRLAVEPEVQDLSDSRTRRYRVLTRVTSQTTGVFLGSGVGECSSEEEKYGWRAAVSDAEFEAADPDNRRVKYKRDGTIQQIRTNPADVANTVLKMAKKRSLVDAILTVTAASDIFTQDLEEMGEMADGASKQSRSDPNEARLQEAKATMTLPNYGHAHAKGKPMDDPAVTIEDLRYYLQGVDKSLADPEKAKWKANNLKLKAALEAELARREQTSTASPPSDHAPDDLAHLADQDIWEQAIDEMNSQDKAAFEATKKKFHVELAGKLQGIEKRRQFVLTFRDEVARQSGKP